MGVFMVVFQVPSALIVYSPLKFMEK